MRDIAGVLDRQCDEKLMNSSFHEKVALVTGAGSGIAPATIGGYFGYVAPAQAL
jgi:hypothetical protein